MSVADITRRDKSLLGFSIYACGVRYVLTHPICLLRKRGIYLISNWARRNISCFCMAKAYRVNEVDISTKN